MQAEKNIYRKRLYGEKNINKNGGIILSTTNLDRMGNIAREFVREHKEFIVCEPSGRYLDDLEMEKKAPVRMKLVE